MCHWEYVLRTQMIMNGAMTINVPTGRHQTSELAIKVNIIP